MKISLFNNKGFYCSTDEARLFYYIADETKITGNRRLPIGGIKQT